MSKISKIDRAQEYESDLTWIYMFKEMIRNEMWAHMSASAKALYPVIKAYVNWKDGAAFPTYEMLQRYSGLTRPSVAKGLDELEEKGFLVKTTEKGMRSRYALVESFDVKDPDGKHAAKVSFDYLPVHVEDAVCELRNFVAHGLKLPDGQSAQFIHIDALTLNLATDGGRVINNNLTATTATEAGNPLQDEKTLAKGIIDAIHKRKTKEAKLVWELTEKYADKD